MMVPSTSPMFGTSRFSEMWWKVAFYVGLLTAGIGIFFIVRLIGQTLEAPAAVIETQSAGTSKSQVNVLLHVVATLTAVIGLGTLLGYLLRLIGQPSVIGEVLAGIILGPSLMGLISPQVMHFFIPAADVDPNKQVSSALYAISQIGVILYMFLVGLELNATRLKQQAHSALAIAHTSMILPFVLGAILSLCLYPLFSSKNVSFTSFALFMGAAMSVTAFPVLARILTDRSMGKSELGIVALGCAAADDITAWCLLAVVVGVAKSDMSNIAWILGLTIGFIALMFLIVRPIITKICRSLDQTPNSLNAITVSCVFLGLLVCSLITEAIGIHAVIGAFLLGVILPHEGKIARELTDKLKIPVATLLLPAFFAYSGMRMQLGLLDTGSEWLWCIVIIIVATAGKLGGTLIAAKLTGMSWRDSFALGALMNTRGLMALVVLNIGLDMGVLSPKLFAMLVVMAIVTTAMTTPILQITERWRTFKN